MAHVTGKDPRYGNRYSVHHNGRGYYFTDGTNVASYFAQHRTGFNVKVVRHPNTIKAIQDAVNAYKEDGQ